MASWFHYFRTAEWVISLLQQVGSVIVGVSGILISEKMLDIPLNLSKSMIVGGVSALLTFNFFLVVFGRGRTKSAELPLAVQVELARNRQRFWHDLINSELGGFVIFGGGILIAIIVIASIVYVFRNYSVT